MNKSINTLRKESQLKTMIAQIVTTELTNTNIINPTVIDCELSADSSHAKVFVTFSEKSDDGIEAIRNASGFIRKSLSKNLNWRKVPEIHFELDHVIDDAMKIEKILAKIKTDE
ncbi:30S ribosome-binding factor RbfA [Mycoplasma zalophidermidis]|uniref:Ribosome-binding factor A n=1 Tax=Mycoplasma zalophidermidis TaxID=398174 RepID=A0ABS6DR30_9MOLU|nr:30S ribosome-binding factor RbfA [Mycoplasma zalophidermidis]MBU4689568.1 30S ribosome-binding factor RbfA [Mycoplasma zalophidermidis]MBU4693465.1 30S ribosome-binding factor RbfA [Mycoplasma zalophidermidis]MCR8966257.1 30S ribosome-binding factor RbfA [Mycoplasma zalophidermidis]